MATFEWGYDNETVAAMRGKGHEVRWVGPGYSSANLVRRWAGGRMEAVGEVRQGDSGGVVG